MRIRALLMAVAAVVSGGAALAPAEAADQSATAAKAPSYYPNTYYPPATMWTGFYAGLHIGGAWGNGSWTDPYSGLGDRPRGSGVLGGLQLGVNSQWDWLVIGLEADISFTDLKASDTDALGFNHVIQSTWLSTGTARIGYATGPWLLYAKGGIALADEGNSVTSTLGSSGSGTFLTTVGTSLSTSYTVPVGTSAVGPLWSSFHVGWTVGGGVEYALTHNWSARLEYDYIDFNNGNSVPPSPVLPATATPPVTLSSLPILSGFTASPNVSWTIQRVVGAVNYRF
jgi:outer membrane immunogenic protein